MGWYDDAGGGGGGGGVKDCLPPGLEEAEAAETGLSGGDGEAEDDGRRNGDCSCCWCCCCCWCISLLSICLSFSFSRNADGPSTSSGGSGSAGSPASFLIRCSRLRFALSLFSLLSSSVMTQEAFMPMSRHFLNLQNWQCFLVCRVTGQARDCEQW